MKTSTALKIVAICVICAATMMGGCISVETVSDGIQETLSTSTTGEYDLQLPFIVTSGSSNYTFRDGGVLEYCNIYGHSCTGTWVISDMLINENNHHVCFKIDLDDDDIQGPFGEVINPEWVPTTIFIYGKPMQVETDPSEVWKYEQQAKLIHQPPGQNSRFAKDTHAMWHTI